MALMATELNALHDSVRKECLESRPGDTPLILFFSVCDSTKRAKILSATGEAFDEAWENGRAQCMALPIADSGEVCEGPLWLRIDVPWHVWCLTWGELKQRLASTKRNYFRYGISLDERFENAFLEMEVNAHAMFYPRGETTHAVLNEGNFLLHAKTRYGLEGVCFDDGQPVWIFETRSWFADGQSSYPLIGGVGVDAGRREFTAWNGAALLDVVAGGADHLAHQVGDDGRFVYGFFPCFGRRIESYNALRHASTLFSMVDAWASLRSDTLLRAIERALSYMRSALVRVYAQPDGDSIAYLVDEGGEIKLGGSAVALLALVRFAEVTGSNEDAPLMEQLGAGMLAMQNQRTGQFVHVLSAEDLSVKQAFRIVYYDGEAAFALMRLYAHTHELRWLNAVEKAFEHFVAAEHWRNHDHWLAYCTEELTRYSPRESYFIFGLRNVLDHLDFVLERETTFPTLLELMMATRAMIERLRALPELRYLLAMIDESKFERALHFRAKYLLNGFFWPEWAMFFRDPHKICRSFFIRHHGFRVRIDDVEHYLSGLVAYYRVFFGSSQKRGPMRWTAQSIAAVTGGTWWRPPGAEFSGAGGACTWPPAMRECDVVFVRRPGCKGGMPESLLAALPLAPAAIVCVDPGRIAALQSGALVDVPVLAVEDESAALLAMGKAARAQMKACFVGVTGSAGKTTTVAMLARALADFGKVGMARESANLPHGIAWNLASLPVDADYVVMEMAVGDMALNTRLVRPDVAVFTNVGPAHLKYHHSVAEIARKKSLMFGGMLPGSVAVLNRDMNEWQIVHKAALRRNLRVVTYGKHPECDVRLDAFELGLAQVFAFGERVEVRLSAQGEHMVLNAMAVLAVAGVVGRDVKRVATSLSRFLPLPGRGERHTLAWDGGCKLELVDESYNANPLSMHAALAAVARTGSGRLVLVLGDMLELGENEASMHLALKEPILATDATLIILVGALTQDLALEAWPPDRKVFHFDTVEQVGEWVFRQLRGNDLVLVKSSAGTRLSDWVKRLKAHSAAAARVPMPNADWI